MARDDGRDIFEKALDRAERTLSGDKYHDDHHPATPYDRVRGSLVGAGALGAAALGGTAIGRKILRQMGKAPTRSALRAHAKAGIGAMGVGAVAGAVAPPGRRKK